MIYNVIEDWIGSCCHTAVVEDYYDEQGMPFFKYIPVCIDYSPDGVEGRIALAHELGHAIALLLWGDDSESKAWKIARGFCSIPITDQRVMDMGGSFD